MKTNKIYQGNSLDVLKTFPDQSIDMAITSPPYWALRDYGTAGQLGLEHSFEEYIQKLCDIFEETKRVLKDEGTLWVNLGDTYAGGGGNSSKYTCGPNGMDKREHARPEQSINNRFSKWQSDTNDSIQVSHDVPKDSMNVKNKSLIGIPFRFAIEMINRGWILRNTLIWHKNNVMPASIKDRFTVDFEYIFFFSKQQKYYFEQQFEDSKMTDKERNSRSRYGYMNHKSKEKGEVNSIKNDLSAKEFSKFMPLKRNKRTVWSINPKPFKEAHFAVFPEALIETPILAGCPPKGIVLDIFMGSGTTGLVALKNNRKYVGIELNEEYIGMAEKRLSPYKNQSLDGFQDQKK